MEFAVTKEQQETCASENDAEPNALRDADDDGENDIEKY